MRSALADSVVGRNRSRRPRGILWEGPSPVDGHPIVAIATMTRNPRRANRKTGPMVQIYILRRDIPPLEAVMGGQDLSVCGHCPLRFHDAMKKRACYVNIGRGPRSVWLAYKAKSYPLLYDTLPDGSITLRTERFSGEKVRWGAYGDPAMLPESVVQSVNAVAAFHVGYTHQWRAPWARWTRGVFMASVETVAQESRAQALGWGTFRAGRCDGSDIGSSVLCKNVASGATCAECGVCDGRETSIYVPAHGSGSSWIPAERLVRRSREAVTSVVDCFSHHRTDVER